MIKEIPIQDLRIDGSTQQRDVCDEVVMRYCELIKEGVEFPEIEVVFDSKNYWVFDGIHRVFANRKAGQKYIKANVQEGTKRDAIFLSFGANATSGFPRQKGVTKEIILKILEDKVWGNTDDSEIAEHVGVTRSYVSRIKRELEVSRKGTSTLSSKKKSTSGSKAKNDENGEQTTSTPEEVVLKDLDGKVIPKHIREVFERANEIRDLSQELSGILKVVRDGVNNNDPLFAYCKLPQLTADIKNARQGLRFTIPYAVCGYCGADPVTAKDCRACGGKGFVNEMTYKAAPKGV